MWNMVYTALKDLGTPIVGIIIIIGLFFLAKFLFKIATNHLHHIAADVKMVLDKVIKLEDGMGKICERVSYLEGKTATKRVRKTRSN